MRLAEVARIGLFPSAVRATMDWGRHPMNNMERSPNPLDFRQAPGADRLSRRQDGSKFFNENTQPFSVNGSQLPEVDFDVGESYAGLLPIGDTNDTNQLYFWFFPSTNPTADQEILIWLTGGPGCSSVGELLQENGPVLWTPGLFKPVQNKWSWHHLTNVVWIDQPIGSGFSQGEVTAKNEFDVASQFMGFWKNFVDLFSMQGYKIYITGSSYSGMYCPYVAHQMIEAEDPEYFDVGGMMVVDALYSKRALAQDIPAVSFVDSWERVFSFNETFNEEIHTAADECGYTQYLQDFLVFPPSGQQPVDLPGMGEDGELRPECALLDKVFTGAFELNPCFSPYEIFEKCPRPFDPLGFSGGTMYMPPGAGPVYFNRPDVKAAINAPAETEWTFCSNEPVFVDGLDESVDGGPGSQPVLPKVIESTGNVILGHGSQDFILVAAGTLLSIQNITWGGEMGFQSPPATPLFIPYHNNDDIESQAGAGIIGSWHEERGLTYFGVEGAGHFLTMDLPAVAFRGLEVLLGRVENLGSTVSFTTDTNGTVQPTIGMAAESAALAAVGGDEAVSGADLMEVSWAIGSLLLGIATILLRV